MDTLQFGQRTLVRYDAAVLDEFKKAVIDQGRSKNSRFAGKKATMENVTNALWLWFARMTKEEAEAFLGQEFPKLEASMRGDCAGAASGVGPGAVARTQRVGGPGPEPESPPKKGKKRRA